MVWRYAASQDVASFYGVGVSPPTRGILHWGRHYTTVDYPPVALYEMALVGLVYRAIDATYADSTALTALLKAPGLLAGALLAALLYATALRLTGSVSGARWAAIAYWINPATILNGETLAYLDPLVMAPAVGALALVYFNAPGWGGAALGVAVMTKPQALLLAPAFTLAAFATSGVRGVVRAAAAGAVVMLAAAAPFLAVGAGPNMWLAFGSWYARRDILSGNAANIWWIANYLGRAWYALPEVGFPAAYLRPVARIMAISTFMQMGFPNPRPYASAAVLVIVGWACWTARHARDLALHAALGAFTVHAFFVIGVGVHEHHQVLAVPLLGLAAVLRPRFRPLFFAVSLIVALNINIFYGIGLGRGWALPRSMLLIDSSVLLSVANIAALVWHARLFRRECERPAGSPDVIL
jgi:hypothetical protein